jgi:hypothetical protein
MAIVAPRDSEEQLWCARLDRCGASTSTEEEGLRIMMTKLIRRNLFRAPQASRRNSFPRGVLNSLQRLSTMICDFNGLINASRSPDGYSAHHRGTRSNIPLSIG